MVSRFHGSMMPAANVYQSSYCVLQPNCSERECLIRETANPYVVHCRRGQDAKQSPGEMSYLAIRSRSL